MASILFIEKLPAQLTVIYEESQVPTYKLPPILNQETSTAAEGATAWKQSRRTEILRLFENQVYGKTPSLPVRVDFTILHQDSQALCGKAIAKEITATFSNDRYSTSMNLLIILPKNNNGPVPVFLGLNFFGNHTVHSDPFIALTDSWIPNSVEFCITDHKATQASRGVRYNRWPIERILERGYGLATIYCGDLDPDFDDGFQNGVHPLFYSGNQTKPRPNEWGTIGAWAWGLSRAMDYFETDKDIDPKKVAVLGHSRLGKAALWASAQDTRFALTLSNNSGCGGAALSKRIFGETVEHINSGFPHWFCQNFHAYSGKENDLPVDQHMLLALIAPRALYVASAEGDRWADPKGEYLSLYHAGQIYELFGLQGLPEQLPSLNAPVSSGKMAYHIRTGQHDITRYDWERYMDFADVQFGKR